MLVADRAVGAQRQPGADAAAVHEGDLGALRTRRLELRVGDQLAHRRGAGRVVDVDADLGLEPRHHALGDRPGALQIAFEQGRLLGVLAELVVPHQHIARLGGAHVAAAALQRQADVGEHRAVLVAAGDQPAVDAAVVGAVRVAGHEGVDRLVAALHDVDDRAADARALVVAPARVAALVDQHHDGLHAARQQALGLAVDGLGLVVEAQALHAGGHHQAGCALERQADEADRDAVELAHHAGRQQGGAGLLVESAGGQVLEAHARQVLTAQQLGSPFVELVVADRRQLQTHQRQRFERRHVVEQRRQQRRGADQVAGGHEHMVRLRGAQLPGGAGQRLGAAHGDMGLAAVGIAQPEGRRRLQMAVEVVHRQHLQLDGGRGRGRGHRRCGAAGQQGRDGPQGKESLHGEDCVRSSASTCCRRASTRPSSSR